jgi:hypothetical protein
VATTHHRNVQWEDAENFQVPSRYQRDVSVTGRPIAADLETFLVPVFPAARGPSSNPRMSSNTYDLGHSDEEPDRLVRSDLINRPSVSANRRTGREYPNINRGDDGQIESTFASWDIEPLDIAPLLHRIVETNNCLYDYLLRATNIRRDGSERLSPLQSLLSSDRSYITHPTGSSDDLERGTVPESHEQPRPRYTHPPFSHDAVESNVAEFPTSEANSTVLSATPSGYPVSEERERDYYSREGPPPARVQTREREYEEVDTYIRREREPERGSRSEFLREDYGRPDPPERVRTTRIVERERQSPSPPPERIRTRVIEIRERARERTEWEIRERSRERSPERIRVRSIEREPVRAPSPSPNPSPSPPTDPAQSGSQTQSLVLYGTYLPPRNTPPDSIRSRNSTSARSTKSTRSSGNFGAYWYFGFPLHRRPQRSRVCDRRRHQI